MIGTSCVTRLLLDTHIWIWTVSESHCLSPHVAREIESETNELWLSPVSIWELSLLSQKRRIAVGEDFEELIPRMFKVLPVREAPLTFEVARETARLKLPHRDPADYFLVATAKVFDLTLVTADQHLMKVPGLHVLANRVKH